MGKDIDALTLIGYKIPYSEMYNPMPYSKCSHFQCETFFEPSDKYCRKCDTKITSRTVDIPIFPIYQMDEVKLNGETEREKNTQYISVTDDARRKAFDLIVIAGHRWLFYQNYDYVFVCIDIIKADVPRRKSSDSWNDTDPNIQYNPNISKSQLSLERIGELKNKLEKSLIASEDIKNYQFGIWTTTFESKYETY